MKTLILIDLQNDFMPGGPLGVKDADQMIPIINKLLPKFDHIFATKDWHPPHHVSFATTHHKKVGEVITLNGIEQILWPDHCVKYSKGADFAPGLDKEKIEKIFHKGIDPNVDSYSTFFDNARIHSTGLADYLKNENLLNLYFAGVATDYCVLYSVLDALELKFNVWVIKDLCRAINIKEGDEKRALEKMKNKGAQIIDSKELLNRTLP